MSRKLRYSKCVPGGNTTIIIYDRFPRKHQPAIARGVMKLFPGCEQVGFIEPPQNPRAICRLQMMGNEFCGNATRSLAWLIMDFLSKNGNAKPLATYKEKAFNLQALESSQTSGQSVNIPLEVSGYDGLLTAIGRYQNMMNTAIEDISVPMPIRQNSDSIAKHRIKAADTEIVVPVVNLDGISHVIVFDTDFKPPEQAREREKIAMSMLRQLELTSLEAAGVLFCSADGDAITMEPFVYVRDTDTFVPETACGSGTIAIVQSLALQRKQSVKLNVVQPSGQTITGQVVYETGVTTQAYVEGPVQILEEGELSLPDELNPLKQVTVRLVRSVQEFNLYRQQLALVYQTIFADSPYFEKFTLEEAATALQETVEAEDGLLFVAFDGDDAVGFGGGLPVINFPDICESIQEYADPEVTFYMAELGVDYGYRGEGLSHRLVDERLKAIDQKYHWILVRTSVENNPTQYLYRNRRGFKEISGVRMEVVNRKYYPGATEPVFEPDERLFLILDRATAAQNVVIS